MSAEFLEPARRDDELPGFGRRRVEDFDLVVEAAAGEVDVRRPRPAEDGEPAARELPRDEAVLLRQPLRGRVGALERVGADAPEWSLVAGLDARRQIAEEDAAVRRPLQLVAVARL